MIALGGEIDGEGWKDLWKYYIKMLIKLSPRWLDLISGGNKEKV